jgi:hypothetical protein
MPDPASDGMMVHDNLPLSVKNGREGFMNRDKSEDLPYVAK